MRDLTIGPQVPASQFVVAWMCKEIGLDSVIDNLVDRDDSQCKLSPGLLIIGLIVNILCHRTPLYRVKEFFQFADPGALFGDHVTPEDFNDDALGRALDKVYNANPKKVFTAVALRGLSEHKVKISSVHADTTSISVYGLYEGLSPQELQITYGFSKDNRPDLKQFMCGLLVTKEGLPVLADVLDGNESDCKWNTDVIENIEELVQNPLAGDFVYIADSAMVTKENLAVIEKKRLPFISRFPQRYKLAEELKQKAWEIDDWEPLGTFTKQRGAASYKAQSFTAELYGSEYRFVVVHSTSLDKRKEKSLNRRLKEERQQLEKGASELMNIDFACAPDANKALAKFLHDNSKAAHQITGEIAIKSVIKRRPGRPKKDEKPEEITVYKVKIQVGDPAAETIDTLRAQESTFVLITNLMDTEGWTSVDILREYKEQTAVEQKFRFLKDPMILKGIYLKKPSRIETFMYVMVMAILVAALIERKVRKALKESGEELQSYGRIKTQKPTARVIFDKLEPRPLSIKLAVGGNKMGRVWSKPHSDIQKLLEYIGFDMAKYHKLVRKT